MKMYKLSQNKFDGIINRLQREIQKEQKQGNHDWQIVIEPGQGATYNSEDATIYFYGTDEDYSSLAGRTRRTWIESFNSKEETHRFMAEANKAGLLVERQDVTGYVDDEMLDLPDEDGNYDPNFVSPNSIDVRDAIRDSEF